MEPTTAAVHRNSRSAAARKAGRRTAVQGSGSELTALLERIWTKVQAFAAEHDQLELPTVHIITGTGAARQGIKLGHMDLVGRWVIANREGRTHEMFISGETLGRGPESALTTILHEAAHLVRVVQGDEAGGTCRQYRYHNTSFVEAGARFGLEYTHGKANATYGFSALTLSDMGKVLWGAELEALAQVTATIPAVQLVPVNPDDPSNDRLAPVSPPLASPVRVQRRRVAAVCECRTINVFADEADDLVCGKCSTVFVVAFTR